MKILLLLLTTFILLSSCKKCDPTNSFGGEVLGEAFIRASAGQSIPILITDASQVPFALEVLFEGGIAYQSVDFSQYSVLALPTSASCSSGYDRSVVVNDQNQTVTYTVTLTECETCEGSTNIPNWVLIPAIPASYTPVFSIK